MRLLLVTEHGIVWERDLTASKRSVKISVKSGPHNKLCSVKSGPHNKLCTHEYNFLAKFTLYPLDFQREIGDRFRAKFKTRDLS